jgi:hypothetical protein
MPPPDLDFQFEAVAIPVVDEAVATARQLAHRG